MGNREKSGNFPGDGREYVTYTRAGRPKIEMNKATELTDDGLLRRVIAGDEEAFTLLYQRRHPAIYRFALHMSGNSAVADDVTQEVFMTLIRDTRRFDPARGTLGGFLFGIARNHLRKRWEQEKRLAPLMEGAEDFGRARISGGPNGNGAYGNGNGNGNGHGFGAQPHDEFTSLETIGRVRQAIGTLPENYREVVVLCELEEMSYEEAAAALDCPVGTVRSRLHRARGILVEKLREAQPAAGRALTTNKGRAVGE
jgi:RNA polymerase sigma-70 factor, ECF subfamily